MSGLSKQQKFELFRREMAQKALKENFEENYVRELVFIAREMHWLLEYVLGLGVTQYNQTRSAIMYWRNEEAKAFSEPKKGPTKQFTLR